MSAGDCRVVDTNVTLRILIEDDPAQSRAAEALLGERLFLPLTVLLETVWVLSSRYRLSRGEIAALLDRLLELPAMIVDEPEGVAWAIERFRSGADFSDMIHLVAGRHERDFVTFDRQLAKAAGPDAPLSIVTLSA